MATLDAGLNVQLLNVAENWGGLAALALGSALGYLLRFWVGMRQRAYLRVQLGLWEWARHREPGLMPQRRIQQYYRRIRRLRAAGRNLVHALLHAALGVLSLAFALAFQASLPPAVARVELIGALLALAVLFAALTLAAPWLARGLALGLIGFSLAMALVAGPGWQPFLGRDVSLGLLEWRLAGEPRDGGSEAGRWFLGTAAADPALADPGIGLALIKLRWPLGLGVLERLAFREPAWTGQDAGELIASSNPVPLVERAQLVLAPGAWETKGRQGGHRFGLWLGESAGACRLYLRDAAADK